MKTLFFYVSFVFYLLYIITTISVQKIQLNGEQSATFWVSTLFILILVGYLPFYSN